MRSCEGECAEVLGLDILEYSATIWVSSCTCWWNSGFPPAFPISGSVQVTLRFPRAGPDGHGSPPSAVLSARPPGVARIPTTARYRRCSRPGIREAADGRDGGCRAGSAAIRRLSARRGLRDFRPRRAWRQPPWWSRPPGHIRGGGYRRRLFPGQGRIPSSSRRSGSSSVVSLASRGRGGTSSSSNHSSVSV